MINRNYKLQNSQTMKTRFTLVAMVSIALSTTVLGCNTITAATSETRTVDQNFYGVILNGNANVYLTQGDYNSVRVEGLAENTESVITTVSNGALIISAGSVRNVNIFVTLADINLLQVNGAGVIKSTTTINSDMLLMKITGSGIISADVRALSVGMVVNGGGKIYAKGITGDSFVKVRGSGQVITMNLDTLREASRLEATNVEESSPEKHRTRRALSLHQ